MITTIEQAEILGRRRARVLPVLAIIYLTQQAAFFSNEGTQARAVDHLKVGAWAVLTLLLLLILTTKGFWLRNRELRELIDDESTRAHRREALNWGFLVSVTTGVVLYFVDQAEPLTARQAIHAIVSLGLGAAILRFGILERRAHGRG